MAARDTKSSSLKRPAFDASDATNVLPLARKLTLSSPGDPQEREADAVAERVMSSPDLESGGLSARGPSPRLEFGRIAIEPQPGSAALQRQCSACADEDGEQRIDRASREKGPGAAPLDVGAAMRAAESGGQELSRSERKFFEPRFGVDFSRVRVHADATAARAADGVHARAFTLGRNIVFGRGEYAPGTVPGRRLMAHELTHVMQQASGAPASVQRETKEDAPSDSEPEPEPEPGDEDGPEEADDAEPDDDENDTETEKPPEPDEDYSSDAEPLDADPLWTPPSGPWILVKLPGTLYRFEGGKRISAWGISGGRPSNPTPQGKFKIGKRDENHRSSKYGTCGTRKVKNGAKSCKKGEKYVGADMHWYQNFAPQVGFHRGSPRVLSHGCIHLSNGNAKTLWDWASKGTTVIVCSGKACKQYLQVKPNVQGEPQTAAAATPAADESATA